MCANLETINKIITKVYEKSVGITEEPSLVSQREREREREVALC